MRLAILILALALFSPTRGADPLFGDRVVARGKGLEIKVSEIDEDFVTFRANKAAAGEKVSKDPAEIKRIEAEILHHLIATRLILNRANNADKTNAAAFAKNFVQEKRDKTLSEAAFVRQLRALGMTRERFEKDILEQAIVKHVIEREIRSKQTATDEQLAAYYKEHPNYFKSPDRWKVQHIDLGVRDRLTLKELPSETVAAKKKKMEDILKQARAAADFTKLVKENSEDVLTRDERAEYTFSRGEMPDEFEAAAITLKPGQISDVITTRFGFHIIKLIESIPSKTLTFVESKEKIRDAVLQEATQNALPDYLKKLREEAAVEIIADSQK